MEDTNTIHVEKIGPVKRLDIPLPEGGGVTILRGCQGSGKSTVLNGVSKLAGGDVDKVPVMDGAQRGRIVLGSAKLTVTPARFARSGSLEISEIESRLDISQLVDPGIKDPLRADAARIKALVSLSGVKPSPEPYIKLCGGKENYEKLDVDESTDCPVELAARIKRAIDHRAKGRELVASELAGEASSLCKQLVEISGDGETDEAKLRATHEEAIRKLASVETVAEQCKLQQESIEQAKVKLNELAGSTESLEKLGAALDKKKDLHTKAGKEIIELENQLREKEIEQALLKVEVNHIEQAIKDAEEHKKQATQLYEIIQRGSQPGPTKQELYFAKQAVEDAHSAVVKGALLRKKSRLQEELKKTEAECNKAAKSSELLREIAAKVEDVLSSLIPASALQVKNGRLVTGTDRSTEELFADLSHGEKYLIAIPIAVEQLKLTGQPGLLTIRQEAWEGLQPANQRRVAEKARSCGVHILTAEATDDEQITTAYV